jgi:uncharacterized protein YukE
MAIAGLDVDQVRRLSVDLTSRAEDIGDVVGNLDRLIRNIQSIWRGRDADEFVHWWESQHGPALRQVQQAIYGLGQSAKANADEQEIVSSGDTSGSLGTHPGGAITPGNTTPNAPTAPSPLLTDQAVRDFRTNYEGKGVDFDGMYGNQCVDLFQRYNKDVVGGPFFSCPVSGGARDLYEHFPPKAAAFYEKIPAGQAAQPGDVAVWGASPNNQYGHVAIVLQPKPNGLSVIQQNGFNPGAPAYVADHSTANLLGYLRPKKH